MKTLCHYSFVILKNAASLIYFDIIAATDKNKLICLLCDHHRWKYNALHIQRNRTTPHGSALRAIIKTCRTFAQCGTDAAHLGHCGGGGSKWKWQSA